MNEIDLTETSSIRRWLSSIIDEDRYLLTGTSGGDRLTTVDQWARLHELNDYDNSYISKYTYTLSYKQKASPHEIFHFMMRALPVMSTIQELVDMFGIPPKDIIESITLFYNQQNTYAYTDKVKSGLWINTQDVLSATRIFADLDKYGSHYITPVFLNIMANIGYVNMIQITPAYIKFLTNTIRSDRPWVTVLSDLENGQYRILSSTVDTLKLLGEGYSIRPSVEFSEELPLLFDMYTSRTFDKSTCIQQLLERDSFKHVMELYCMYPGCELNSAIIRSQDRPYKVTYDKTEIVMFPMYQIQVLLHVLLVQYFDLIRYGNVNRKCMNDHATLRHNLAMLLVKHFKTSNNVAHSFICRVLEMSTSLVSERYTITPSEAVEAYIKEYKSSISTYVHILVDASIFFSIFHIDDYAHISIQASNLESFIKKWLESVPVPGTKRPSMYDPEESAKAFGYMISPEAKEEFRKQVQRLMNMYTAHIDNVKTEVTKVYQQSTHRIRENFKTSVSKIASITDADQPDVVNLKSEFQTAMGTLSKKCTTDEKAVADVQAELSICRSRVSALENSLRELRVSV